MIRILLPAFAALGLAAAPAGAEPALWRVADEDTEILMFGTVHVMDPAADWLDADLAAAIDAADTLVLETSLDESARAEIGRLTERNAYLADGWSLDALLGPQDAALLARAADALGLDVAGLQSYRPWMASLVLSLRFAQAQGQDQTAGADGVIFARAVAKGARIAPLESAADQIGIFTGLAPSAELAMLVSTAREIVETPDILRRMDAAWLAGDADALADLAIGPMKAETPALYDAALLRRNRAWADALDDMLENRPGHIFLAVGAAHLAGPDSLQSLLQARGWTVERVR